MAVAVFFLGPMCYGRLIKDTSPTTISGLMTDYFNFTVIMNMSPCAMKVLCMYSLLQALLKAMEIASPGITLYKSSSYIMFYLYSIGRR